jgi:acetyltransferase
MTTNTQIATTARPRPLTLANGARLRIRPLRERDAPGYEAFVRGLSAETLYNRLLGAGLAVTAEGLHRLIAVDQVTHVALAATVRAPGGERIVGVARFALEVDPAIAELAVTVADDWQGRGVGRALLNALVRRARVAGVRTLFGDVFPSNISMLVLLQHAGFALASCPGDAHLTRGTRLLSKPRTRKPAARA